MRNRSIVAALALVLSYSGPLASSATKTEYTRSANAEAMRPKADISEATWLAGIWEGPGIEGAASQEGWLNPLGGMMHGTFVQSDGKGGIMFTEHMQIAPDGDSLVVRLKHFNADLTGWEEKAKTVTFPLVAKEKNALYFNGLTYRLEAPNRLLVAVRMKHSDGKTDELVFRFTRKRR